MANVVTSQTILDGDRLAIFKFTNISDGTAETGVVKVTASSLNKNQFGDACNGLILNKVWHSTHGMEVEILWEASTNQLAWVFPQNTSYWQDFSSFGGIQNNAGAGKTGNIAFTTLDASAGDVYTVILECIKTYVNPIPAAV
jgi:hypothetical protein